MAGVATHAVAVHFAVDAGAAGLGVLQFFEHQQPGAFAEDEAVAVAVEGATGVGRIVVPLGKRPHGGEGAQADVRQRGLAAAGDDHVGLVAADQLEGVADGVGGAGAGGDDHLVRPAQPVLDRQLRAGGVADQLGDGEGRDSLGPLVQQPLVLDFDRFQAADAGAEDHAAAPRIVFREVDARVARRR